ncbi:sigma-54-dependent transcriptional regulator [Gilvimarinus algae]|uniref:Sigma-54 dependent transcriptional regulator n=1 Tax=Gilvimarinus algae TaxID=3058037 RepID=A0ABT8TGT2_9GAMM|nr:sigma-54 dependent transcriptional regulator [Gilvimarinus sp. SDUM040014]MDO3382598.1 sigma-54 dependent transcriptional regulator [Gilvimarinus sp. SDUM040014]
MDNTAVQLSQDTTAAKVLVVEDDPSLREALVDTLALSDYAVCEAESAEQAMLCLRRESDIRLIVSDVNMGTMSGYDLLRQVKTEFAHIPLLLMTAYASIADSVAAIKEGAVDYLVKPFDPETLLETVGRHLGAVGLAKDEPVAEAESSKKLLQLAQRVAQSESTVLVIGESGTGKEVLARYIHDHSPRADKPFIAINCAAIPENMLEATLFGHEKGAYTGAHTSAPGKFEQANGGTLLLDEISEMDIGLQAKLLRVLQEREVERLGGRKTISLDVRVIATSNRDMREAVMEGQFREDLYYRLSILPLQWAPLRDRVEDIVPLAEKLLAKHAKKQKRSGVRLDQCARIALAEYRWPGNVRELDNVMQRALILQPGKVISAADLGLVEEARYSAKPSLMEPRSIPQARVSAQPSINEEALVAEREEPAMPVLGSDLRQREFEIIRSTLLSERGSRKNTADRLGISARTLRYKIARLKDEGYALDI